MVYVSDILNVSCFFFFFVEEWKIKRKIHFDIFEIAIGETTNYANFYKVFFILLFELILCKKGIIMPSYKHITYNFILFDYTDTLY